MNFEKDIFISYAHIDDEPMSEGMKGWISEFHKSLEVRLSQLLGSHPVIWRDARLQGNDFFGPEIVAQFPKLKVMMSIITPRYVKSDWCTKEVEEFFKAANETGGISIENKARIFKILKTPVKLDAQPEKIREILGYEFYKEDPTTGRFKEFDRIFGQEIEQAYWAKLDDVAHDVAQLIEKLGTSVTPSTNGNKPEVKTTSVPDTTSANGSAAKRKIYLADTTYDLRDYHESLKRELEDNGFSVVPNKNMTPVADIFKSEVETFINDAILSIHLIGSSYGLVPEGTDKSIIVLQNEIAAKQSAARSLNRLIWIPPTTKSDDARQQSFIEQLKHSEELQQDSDLLEGTVEEFKFAIFDNIRKQEAKEKEKENALEKEKQKENSAGGSFTEGDAGPRLIYIICDQRDLSDTKALEDYLFDSGHEVMLPIFEGEEAQLRKEHEENLRQCDAVILYYGNANELWLRSMTRDLLRLPALGRAKPLLSKIAYLANPSTPQKERFRSNELTVINGLTGFNPQLLNDFMGKLK
ncbi:MAG TPA: hypothetical protein VE978_05965 [Chitinophagales bacterium]|nr:hypothetical protein [Chitinophagales bacterium]